MVWARLAGSSRSAGEPRRVAESQLQRDVRAARHDVHLDDQVDVGERAAPETDEPRRIEPRVQILQPAGDRVPLVFERRQIQQFPSATIDAICDTGRMMISSRRLTGIRSRDALQRHQPYRQGSALQLPFHLQRHALRDAARISGAPRRHVLTVRPSPTGTRLGPSATRARDQNGASPKRTTSS
jgi:hypothetical protein